LLNKDSKVFLKNKTIIYLNYFNKKSINFKIKPYLSFISHRLIYNILDNIKLAIKQKLNMV